MLSPLFLLNAFCLSYTNKWFFKFQRWPLRRQSQKQLHCSLETLMIFKSRHTGANNNVIDTAHAAMLVSHVMEISNESVCCCPINSPARGAVKVVAFWYYSEDEKGINSVQSVFDLIASNSKCNYWNHRIDRWVNRWNIIICSTDK